MKLHTDHLAYLIQLEQGLKTEFFTALSATKKKLVLDLAEAKLIWIDDANRINITGHVNELFKHLSDVFHSKAIELKTSIEGESNGQTQQSKS